MDTVDDVIAIAEHEWRSMGIGHRDRKALAADLRHELEAAAADGVSPRQLLGDDVRAFARTVAVESGTTRMPHEIRRLLLTALTGAAPGLFLGWICMWVLPTYGTTALGGYDTSLNTIGLFGLAPAAILIGAPVGVSTLTDLAEIRRTVRAMALLLPVTGILITPVVMGFAFLTGFSTSALVVFLEVAIVAAALSGATVLARRWALAPALDAARSPLPG